jgi:hypothetical protein
MSWFAAPVVAESADLPTFFVRAGTADGDECCLVWAKGRVVGCRIRTRRMLDIRDWDYDRQR